MFLKLLLLEFVLLSIAGFSLFGRNKGMILSTILVSLINYLINSPASFWFWEIIIMTYGILGILINSSFNHKTRHLRVVKVSAGSVAALLASGLFLPFFPALIAWTVGIGIPLIFTYREIPRSLFLQIIFKFIFSTGWLIIGNILY
ncbi:MAG: hypothetical protein GX434_15970 [Peptococcaceae bacterium]|nr:hypothetical protein [Peptococcaceae bacterium]